MIDVNEWIIDRQSDLFDQHKYGEEEVMKICRKGELLRNLVAGYLWMVYGVKE